MPASSMTPRISVELGLSSATSSACRLGKTLPMPRKSTGPASITASLYTSLYTRPPACSERVSPLDIKTDQSASEPTSGPGPVYPYSSKVGSRSMRLACVRVLWVRCWTIGPPNLRQKGKITNGRQ